MIEVCVRRSDRVILQFGRSLGAIAGADVVELSDVQEQALKVASSTPRKGLTLELNGSIGVLAPDPVEIRPVDPDVAICNAFVDNPAPILAEAAAALKAYLRLIGYGAKK